MLRHRHSPQKSKGENEGTVTTYPTHEERGHGEEGSYTHRDGVAFVHSMCVVYRYSTTWHTLTLLSPATILP